MRLLNLFQLSYSEVKSVMLLGNGLCQSSFAANGICLGVSRRLQHYNVAIYMENEMPPIKFCSLCSKSMVIGLFIVGKNSFNLDSLKSHAGSVAPLV